MRQTGTVAFSIILGIGAVTGILAFFLFQQVTPGHKIFTPSMFFQPLPPPLNPSEPASDAGDTFTAESANQTGSTSQIPANAVIIHILEGAAVQGNPGYQPDKTDAKADSTLVWMNDDTASHTVTSGTGPQDANAGKQFDSSIIEPGSDYNIAASKIGSGEHPYFCQIHPYMKGSVAVG
jgi:plastocyanin